MTADHVPPPSGSQFLMTDAAQECLDTALGLAGTMAPHTRHARFLEAAGTQALGGIIDGLDVYYRRLRELIDPMGPITSKAHENRDWLNTRLGGSPLSDQQQNYVALLKDIRNLSVHNNGLVDVKFQRRRSSMFSVGDRVPVHLYSGLAAPALLGVVKAYDQQVVEKYPSLGRIIPYDRQRHWGELIEAIYGMISATHAEWSDLEGYIADFNTSGLPFTFEGVQVSYTQPAFGLRWMVKDAQDGFYALSFRAAAVGPFTDESALQSWLKGGRMSADRIVSREVDETGWVTAKTDEGFSLYGHPDDLAQIVES